jgi:NAD(P)-dependent dehydrogenase (short-subunit alcohol dehydrogenase family)
MTEAPMTDPGTAMIVGVGPGLGWSLCRRFAEGGHPIALAARDIDKLSPLIAEIESGGGTARAYATDAADEISVAGLFEAAENDLGPVQVAIYNAAGRVAVRTGGGGGALGRNRQSILERNAVEFEDIWRVSCFGGMLVGREAARRMVGRGAGTILFTGGSGSRRAEAFLTPFAVGKFGLRAVAMSMARELGPKGIHVAHLLIEGSIDNETSRARDPKNAGNDGLMSTEAIAEAYYQTHLQHRSAWAMEIDLRPWSQPF